MSLLAFLEHRAALLTAGNTSALGETMYYPCSILIGQEIVILRNHIDYVEKIDSLIREAATDGPITFRFEVMTCRTLEKTGHADIRYFCTDETGKILCVIDASYLCSRDISGEWSINMAEFVTGDRLLPAEANPETKPS